MQQKLSGRRPISGSNFPSRAPRRLLALGLDGGDFDFVRTRLRHLPTIASLIGAGDVRRPDGPRALSGSIWPTFYHGTHPGNHGVYQHLVWDEARMGLKVISPEWVLYRPFWRDLEEQGHDVVVFDVPYSFPTALKRGVEITDWGTHGQTHPTATNRPEVMQVLRRFGKSPIRRETPIAKTQAKLQSLLPPLKEAAHRKGLLIRQFMRDLEWDVFIAVFGETHRGGHLYFSDGDRPDAPLNAQSTRLLEVYRSVDAALAGVLSETDERTDVLLFSVHGMTTNWNQEHAAEEVVKRLNQRLLAEALGEQAPRPAERGGLLGRVRAAIPDRVQHEVGAAAPDWFRRWVVEREIIGGLDWARTPGFLLRGDIRSELRLNLAGREAQGMLVPGSALHQRYVALLRQAFEDLTDADTGQRLVAEFVDIHATFPGELSEHLPDYVVDWQPAPHAARVRTPLLGEFAIHQPGTRGGDHIDIGFAALRPAAGSAPGALPPLKKTSDFAGFITALAQRSTAPAPAIRAA